MRPVLIALSLMLVAGCQEVEPEPSPDLPVEPAATATPESRTTPDVPLEEARDGDASDEETVTVLFFGDSLTAGYGLETPELAYPALVGAQLAEAGVPAEVVNLGNSGETSAGGRGRIDWVLRQHTPDVFVLALGGNDALRGVDPAATQENLSAILDAVEAAAPDARLVVAGMEAPPNNGADYTERFRSVFPAVAEAHDATLIPFLLEDVAGIARLNQPDGIHPTAEGQRIVAETVAEAVVPVARRAAS